MWRQQQVLSRAGVNCGLMDCRPLVEGLRPCSFCGVPFWYAKPPGHIFGGSGGGSLQPQPSPSQCHASHLWRVRLLPTAGHSLRSGLFCVPLDDGPMFSLIVRCTPFCSYCTGSDTPHLSAVVRVWDPLGQRCGGLAYHNRTPQNDQGWRPSTNGLQSINPSSAPALLRTCCVST